MAEADMTVVELPLETAGSRLRRAREEAGLSLADITARTKISERHLALIEQGNFAALPARTYAVGFSRTYARAVGLSGEDIVTMVRTEMDGAAPEPDARAAATFEPGDPARVAGSGIAWIAGLAAVVIVIAGLVFWRPTSAELPSPVPSETAAPAASAPPPAVQPSGPVVFTAQESGLWVKFYDGAGNQLMQKQMAQGESYTVPADVPDVKLWTARPDALAITIGGQPVPRLSDVQATVKDVPVSAAALLARTAAVAAPIADSTSAVVGAAAGAGAAQRPSAPRTIPAARLPRPAASEPPAVVATPESSVASPVALPISE